MLQPQKRPQSFSFLHMGWIIIRGSFSDNFFGEYLQELGGKNYQKWSNNRKLDVIKKNSSRTVSPINFKYGWHIQSENSSQLAKH